MAEAARRADRPFLTQGLDPRPERGRSFRGDSAAPAEQRHTTATPRWTRRPRELDEGLVGLYEPLSTLRRFLRSALRRTYESSEVWTMAHSLGRSEHDARSRLLF